MKRLEDVFACWESLSQMATDVGESHWAVAKWRQRRRIPSNAWPRLIKALKRKGKNVSADDLLSICTRRSKASPVTQPYNGGDAA
jgi:hypothetical protein